jgi:hypothetical protein
MQFIFFVENWKNIKKSLLSVWTTLFMKNDNYVNKEYEEVNEWSVVVRRWGYIFIS